MEFITAEEFLKQDKEVQEVFINWWKPSLYDLVSYEHIVIQSGPITYKKDTKCLDTNSDVKIANINKKDYIPLLTEGQLRKFIEDKTGVKYIGLEHYFKTGYDIYVKDMIFEDLGNDLLQAYWKVAVQIAKEEVLNEKI